MHIYPNFINELLAQFNGAVTVEMILLSLLSSFVISLLIVFVYKITFSGIVFNKNSVYTIVLLSMVTSLIIRTINSNLSLSLGMVGALSIVRFRTAIKDPVDTAFMFWAITAGIMSGAGLYVIALIGSLLLGVLFYIVYLIDGKAKSRYLLVIKYTSGCEENLNKIFKAMGTCNLKSKSLTNSYIEVTYEVSFKGNSDKYLRLIQSLEQVLSVNLVSYNSDFGF